MVCRTRNTEFLRGSEATESSWPSRIHEEWEPSAVAFVANVIFGGIAVVLAIVFIATLTPGARTSLVMALTIGLVFGILVVLALRPRPRDGSRRRGRSPGVVTGLFAAISALLIMLAFVVPPEFGASLAILGLGGLFLVRLAAFHSRGAWLPSTRPMYLSPRRLLPTLYVSPGDSHRGIPRFDLMEAARRYPFRATRSSTALYTRESTGLHRLRERRRGRGPRASPPCASVASSGLSG